jgi:ubiquinone/menaquinone biosynthesis C-methylase UbiE
MTGEAFWNEAWSKEASSGQKVDWPRARRNAEKIVTMLGLREAERVLDVACGRGAEAIELASRGLWVTGLDFSAAALDIAQELSRERGVHVEWICADMRELPRRSYDAVLLRDVIFGCFPTDEDNDRVLDEVRAALRPGGRFLLEVYTKEFAVRHGIEKKYTYSSARDVFVWRGGPPGVGVIRLYSRERLIKTLDSRGLRLIGEERWRRRGDPPGPPFRGWVLLCLRQGAGQTGR